MIKCGQDCAIICENCKHFKPKENELYNGYCVRLENNIYVGRYYSCDNFHCKRSKKALVK